MTANVIAVMIQIKNFGQIHKARKYVRTNVLERKSEQTMTLMVALEK